MKICTYINDELIETMAKIDEDKLSSITKILLQNPLILNLSEIGCIPNINSLWDGEIFSDIRIENYSQYVGETDKTSFAIILENKVVTVMDLYDEKYIAIMSSNPVFRLEEDTF